MAGGGMFQCSFRLFFSSSVWKLAHEIIGNMNGANFVHSAMRYNDNNNSKQPPQQKLCRSFSHLLLLSLYLVYVLFIRCLSTRLYAKYYITTENMTFASCRQKKIEKR